MGSKYSSGLKQDQNHSHGSASTSYARTGTESAIDGFNIFHSLSCWKCICFRPGYFKQARNRPADERSNNNNNNNDGEKPTQGVKDGNENHAMQIMPDGEVSNCDEKRNHRSTESQAEVHQNDPRNISERSCSSERNRLLLRLGNEARISDAGKRSSSLKSCRVQDEAVRSDPTRRTFLSRLASLSVEGRQRFGYLRQRDSEENEEEKNELDELLDHGRYSYEGGPDFLGPVDSMEYFEDTPSTDGGLGDSCFRFRQRGETGFRNLSSDLYEESCLENLESFCDGSVLLASMDTVDLGSSVGSLPPSPFGSRDNVAYERSPTTEDFEGCVVMDMTTYRSIMEDLEACREMLARLERVLSEV